MILGKKAILDKLKTKELEIDPLNKSNIGPASIDLTLGNTFFIFEPDKNTISVAGDMPTGALSGRQITSESITIKPGEFILGITQERIKLSENLAGWLQGRSSLARLGIAVHITASFIQPGSNNKQVLEIFNIGSSEITIPAGTKICQLILETVKGGERYSGKFQHQDKPNLF